MAKGWNLTWLAPETVMVAEPLELSIQRSKDPPARVRIEVFESDAQKHEVDDYEDAIKKRKKAAEDDLLGTFTGTLAPRPGDANGSLFQFESGGPVLGKDQASDHVVITFEGSTRKFACGVPDDPDGDPEDGGFYEVYAQLFDADAAGGKPLATTHVHLVRRRTDLLLRAEPLNQAGATLSNSAMGRMVLKFFHDGNQATKNREWGDIVLGTFEGNATDVTIGNSGCNITVLTMALRYMRRPKSDADADKPPAEREWISIFDEVVEKGLKDPYKPFVKVREFPRFSMEPKEIDATANALFKENKSTWKAGPKIVVDGNFTELDATKAAKVAGCRKKATIPDHWWVPKLLWWIRQQESGEADKAADAVDTVVASTSSWEVTLKDKTTEKLDAVHDDGSRILRHKMISMNFGKFAAADGRPMPPYEGELKQKLKFKVKSIDMSDASAGNWDARLKKHLRRGLPAIAHVKSGRYLTAEKAGGHYLLVVGYREVDGVLRFIVNDPAGVKKLQYESFRENDVTPTEAQRQYLTELRIPFRLSRGEEELGTGEATFTAGQLEDALTGTFTAQTFDLTGAGAGIKVKITSEGGTSVAGTQNFGAFQYGAEVKVGADAALSVSSARAKAKGIKGDKTGKRTGSASHTEGDLALELAFHGKIKEQVGTRVARSWEGRHNGLVERRRHDSLFALHLYEPTFKWEEGAAQWLVFDGKVKQN